jgi:beta-glucosidase-like glycosyl hydrolase
MVGHGLAEGGFNQAPAHVGPRELRDEQLLPFEAAVRGAGIASVMPAYCDLDGVPCHASHELLTSILRDEWGFDGVVASDYTAVQMLVGEHLLTSDLGTAATMALRAGMDNELPTTAAFGAPLRQAVQDGRVDVDLIDLAVARTLHLKFRLGLFDRPYVEPPTALELAALTTVEQGLARDLAQRSMTLVENDGTLPLSRISPGSLSSGRSPTAPATCSATTPICPTSRRSQSCATRQTRSASHPARSSTRSTSCRACRRSSAHCRDRFGERVVHARGSGLAGRHGRGAGRGGRARAGRRRRDRCGR